MCRTPRHIRVPCLLRCLRPFALPDVPVEGSPIPLADPNDSMRDYALRAADKAALPALGHSVRFARGVGEAVPLADGCADAVVSTLTLCSVRDQHQCLLEVARVLKPGCADPLLSSPSNRMSIPLCPSHVLRASALRMRQGAVSLSRARTLRDGSHPRSSAAAAHTAASPVGRRMPPQPMHPRRDTRSTWLCGGGRLLL